MVSRELVSMQVRPAREQLGRVGQLPDDAVVADPRRGEPWLRRRAPGHRRARRRDRVPARRRPTPRIGPGARRSPRRADVRRRSRPAPERRAGRRPRPRSRRTSSMSSGGGASRVEQRAQLAVALHLEREVVRLGRLALGDDGDERRPRSSAAARSWSAAARRSWSSSRSTAACRTTSRRRAPGNTRVASGSVSSLSSQRAVQLPRQRIGREVCIRRGEQVGAADIADEQRVAGQHAVRRRVVGVLVHHDADRLRRVSRRRQDLEHDVAEHEPLAVVQRLDRRTRPRHLRRTR